jgi:molybdenum cofactor cytidylyltransferase
MLQIERCIITHMSMTLARALRIGSSPCIAFTGAGGKTTALFQLARQLPPPVIVTATSHLGIWQIPFADKHIITETPSALEEIEDRLRGVILVTGSIEEDRTKPINDNLLDWLRQFCGYHSIPLLIEADGARQKPLKAWAGHEPAVPPFVDHVLQVAGLAGLGKLLNDESVHRPELFSKLSGLKIGEPITTESLIRVLEHVEGGLKNIPIGARVSTLLNQADTPELQSLAHAMVQPLLAIYHSVVISNLKEEKILAVHEPIAGIVLAAGQSSRFGQPKQLLDWHGQPFVRAVAQNALDAGLSPVVVVIGANGEKVGAAVMDMDVKVVRNDEWKNGQASSIKAGVLSLPSPSLRATSPKIFGFGEGWEAVGGAVFLLADQPQITTSVIRGLVEKHAEGLYPIVAPMVLDQRANPVLFDRGTFSDLTTLEGDVGGRAIFHKHRVEYLPWHDDSLLLDVDTPEHYQRLISSDTG